MFKKLIGSICLFSVFSAFAAPEVKCQIGKRVFGSETFETMKIIAEKVITPNELGIDALEVDDTLELWDDELGKPYPKQLINARMVVGTKPAKGTASISLTLTSTVKGMDYTFFSSGIAYGDEYKTVLGGQFEKTKTGVTTLWIPDYTFLCQFR